MHQATDRNRLHSVELRTPIVIQSPTDPPAPERSRFWYSTLPQILVAVSVIVGIGLRVFAYARNQSLWIDEAMLALNVVYRTPAELLQPLDLNQGAPVGYLLMSKAMVLAFGGSEYALRGISLLAGLASVVVFTKLAYQALSQQAARIAVSLFALSPFLIGYSAEFKQYELDAALAVGLMAVGLPVWRGEAGRWRLLGFAIAGAMAVWFSHPAAFVLGGLGVAALADAIVRRDRGACCSRLAIVATWSASFGLCYFFFTRKLGMNQYLLDYWAGKFLPLPPTRPGDFAWIVHHFLEFFDKPGGLASSDFGGGGLASVCFLVGGVLFAKTDWRLLVALVTPLLLAMLASGLHKYPFAGRLLLFAVPAMLLVVAHGAALIVERLRGLSPLAGVVVLAVLFVAPIAECNWHVKRPIHAEDTREVVARMHAQWQPDDRAYIFYGAAPTFAYYSPQFPFPPAQVRFGVENRGGDQKVFQRELTHFKGSARVWVLIAHRNVSEETAIQAYLDSMGTCQETLRLTDAVLFRYDLSTPGNRAAHP